MSGKVSNMSMATLLSGCVTDDEMSAGHMPFRMEERYPLTTKEAVALRQADAATLCRNWTRDLSNTASNEVAPNHGCAVRVNMAAQLADPTDLDQPNPISPAPAAPASNAVNDIGNSAPAVNRSIFSLF
jgi:type IV pilus biogenesis protein CpaD/CtpE